MSRNPKLKDCNAFTADKYTYTFGQKWAYAVRGATKKYRLEIAKYERLLEKMCERNWYNDLSRTMVIVGFIKEKGEEV
jgi:hypothetical protein